MTTQQTPTESLVLEAIAFKNGLERRVTDIIYAEECPPFASTATRETRDAVESLAYCTEEERQQYWESCQIIDAVKASEREAGEAR